jgi:hypothetical protein
MDSSHVIRRKKLILLNDSIRTKIADHQHPVKGQRNEIEDSGKDNDVHPDGTFVG